MNNRKVAKFVTKNAFGLAVAAILGYIIKLEHKVEDRIDEHFDEEDPNEEDSQQ